MKHWPGAKRGSAVVQSKAQYSWRVQRTLQHTFCAWMISYIMHACTVSYAIQYIAVWVELHSVSIDGVAPPTHMHWQDQISDFRLAPVRSASLRGLYQLHVTAYS